MLLGYFEPVPNLEAAAHASATVALANGQTLETSANFASLVVSLNLCNCDSYQVFLKNDYCRSLCFSLMSYVCQQR